MSNPDARVTTVDEFQSKYSALPDYSGRSSKLGETPEQEANLGMGWTSFAGVVGSIVTMVVIWLTAWILRKRQPQ